jgi:hypothetical protein
MARSALVVMKMVFFSADRLEVQRLRKELADAGIACEVRKEIVVEGEAMTLAEEELWIHNDADSHRAFLACVERNAGFARRDLNGFSSDNLSEGLAA